MASINWFIGLCIFFGLLYWGALANSQRQRKSRITRRRREPIGMQAIIPEKPKCYGDGEKIFTHGVCGKCVVNDDCHKVAFNLFLAQMLQGKIQYNYPELKQTYENY